MRLTCIILCIPAFAFSYIETKQGGTNSVNIMGKLTQDLQSSPSGYIFHHRSDSVNPGGYDADVNRGKRRIVGQVEMEKLAEINGQGKIGTYKLAGGYGFVISHDYGDQKSLTESNPRPVHSGGSNADLESITVLQLGSKDSGRPSIDENKESESAVGTGKSQELDGYIEKEIYGSYMEYDKLVKDGKKGPSVYPGEYYESDVHDEKGKYESGDGYGGSNNAGDKRRYLESEKYDGALDYNENEDHGALRGRHDYVDDGETDKYVIFEEYGGLDELNAKKKSRRDEEYVDSEYNHEDQGPYRANYQLTNRDENYEAPSMHVDFRGHNTNPEFEDMRSSFLDDFFKEYNEFSKGANIQAGFKNDHQYDNSYHGDHADEDEHSRYGENGESVKDFFDDSDSNGYHHEEGGGGEDGHFGEKKGHKKGSKTTGYRNVLHKDEYNKDHTFYEHAKNDGHFNKDGDYDEHEYQHEDAHENGRHHDSSSNDDHHGKTDSEDKGHAIDDDASDHYENGHKSYFNDNSDYSHEGGSRYGSEYEQSYDSEPNH